MTYTGVAATSSMVMSVKRSSFWLNTPRGIYKEP
jgi:hypothetical protein